MDVLLGLVAETIRNTPTSVGQDHFNCSIFYRPGGKELGSHESDSQPSSVRMLSTPSRINMILWHFIRKQTHFQATYRRFLSPSAAVVPCMPMAASKHLANENLSFSSSCSCGISILSLDEKNMRDDSFVPQNHVMKRHV